MRFIPLIIALVAISACKKEETFDVDFYLANDAARTAKVKECRNNPGELRDSANCINALEALGKKMTSGGSMPAIK